MLQAPYLFRKLKNASVRGRDTLLASDLAWKFAEIEGKLLVEELHRRRKEIH